METNFEHMILRKQNGKTISILTWLNRVIMLFFLSLILIGILISEYFFYALLLAVLLGVFQIIAALVLSPLIVKKDAVNFKKLNLYTKSVGIYFVICFVLYFMAEFIPYKINFIGYILMLLPIILSLFFTYTVEQIYKINYKRK